MSDVAEQNNAQSVVRQSEGRAEDGRFLPGRLPPTGRPWQEGQSGNGRAMEAALKRYLAQATERPGESRYQAVMRTLADVAADERHPAWAKAVQMVLDRTDGAVPKKLEISGDLPLKVVVRGDRE